MKTIKLGDRFIAVMNGTGEYKTCEVIKVNVKTFRVAHTHEGEHHTDLIDYNKMLLTGSNEFYTHQLFVPSDPIVIAKCEQYDKMQLVKKLKADIRKLLGLTGTELLYNADALNTLFKSIKENK